jgi:hypothetical protein
LKEDEMKKLHSRFGLISGLGLLISALPAFAAPSTVNDQIPAPVPSASNTTLGSEVLLQSYSVGGGTLYQSCFRGSGGQGAGGNGGIPLDCSGLAFVPTNLSGSFTRYISLADAREDSGLPPTSATGSATAFGVARTAGASYSLVGAATSASAVTTKAMWETNVASTYQSGTAIPIVVNGNYTGSGTVTAASTTFSVAAYTEVGGVETAISGVTAAQQFTGTPANYTFNIPSTAGLVPGQHIAIEVTMLVTTSANAATGQINAIGVTD